jgi:hypothetical protein
MKKLLILFGCLDLVSIIDVGREFTAWYEWQLEFFMPAWVLIPASVLMFSSLIASGILLIKQDKKGIWLTYLQFPFRAILHILSFGFLMPFVPDFPDVDSAPIFFPSLWQDLSLFG